MPILHFLQDTHKHPFIYLLVDITISDDIRKAMASKHVLGTKGPSDIEVR